MSRKTHRSKSYRRRHSRRRRTVGRRRGGKCGCLRGGRGYTTGAAATLAQYSGTPGLSN